MCNLWYACTGGAAIVKAQRQYGLVEYTKRCFPNIMFKTKNSYLRNEEILIYIEYEPRGLGTCSYLYLKIVTLLRYDEFDSPHLRSWNNYFCFVRMRVFETARNSRNENPQYVASNRFSLNRGKAYGLTSRRGQDWWLSNRHLVVERGVLTHILAAHRNVQRGAILRISVCVAEAAELRR